MSWTSVYCAMDGAVYFCAVVLLLAANVQFQIANALECECTECSDAPTDWKAYTCVTSGACYVKISRMNDQQSVSRGCIPIDEVTIKCLSQSESSILCCYDDYCNSVRGTPRELKAVNDGSKSYSNTTNMSMEDNNSSSDDSYKMAAIITVSVCVSFLTMTVIVSTGLCMFYCYCSRLARVKRRDSESGQNDSRISSLGSYGGDSCEAIIPQGETIEALVQALRTTCQSSSSLSLLIQRTIVRHTSLERSVGKGRFCELFVGIWRTERVFVKVYPVKYESLWFTETELYQLPYMRHENILCFVAADIVQRNTQVHHYLVSEYHERGILFEYLQTTVLDVYSVIMLAHSIANGLAYLHSEVSTESGIKPTIVHRNLTSKSVFVKADGTACIGDLAFSIKGDGNIELEVQSCPPRNFRYLAPEILGGPVVKDIDSLRKTDMYSYGLVLWEIAQRCAIQGMVEDVVLPYSDVTHSNPPSQEEMREIVCVQQHRPPIPDQWNRDESMRVIVRMVTECWHYNSTVRLTALRVKKTLEKLSSSVKPYYDKNGKIVVTEIDRNQFYS